MKRLVLLVGPAVAGSALVLAALTVGGTSERAAAQTIVDQQNGFGTITRGSTVCVGPMSPDSSGPGVQIFGFTNGTPSLKWQVIKVSYNTAPVVVFETVARSVDQTIPPEAGFLYEACVVKENRTAQDFNVTLNSFPVE